MTDAELRSELLVRKDKLVRQVKDLQEQINACDALIAALPKQPDLIAAAEATLSKIQSASLQATVEHAIDIAPKEFSVRDVFPVVERMHPPGSRPNKDSVSMAFWKAVNSRGYEIVEKGKGSRPTIYRKP